MQRILLLFIMILILLPLLSAEATQPTWSWNTYTGVSHWHVVVTEDDTGCQAGINTESRDITIQHNGATATMGDVGHGPAEGTFTSSNTLHIPARTVSDPPGSSTLSDYDVLFTPDCSAFSARYTWVYTDQAGSCSGSTSLSGSNSAGCPKSEMETELEQVKGARPYLYKLIGLYDELDYLEMMQRCCSRNMDYSAKITDLWNKINELEPTVEGSYQVILAAYPKNGVAYLDMAMLKLKQGGKAGPSGDFYLYLGLALKAMSEAQKKGIEDNTAKNLGLSTTPTTGNSGVMSELSNEENNWQGPIEGQDFQKEYSDKSTRNVKLFATLGSSTDVINSVSAK